MIVLALDLSNFQSSIAFVNGDDVLYHHTSDQFRGQDVTLLSKIKSILNKNKLTPSDIDLIVSTSGPGSFTGIRVALATLQGLSLAAGVPAIAIDSFSWVDATWRTAGGTGKSLVILESMRDELYVQAFDEMGSVSGDPAMRPKQALNDFISTVDQKVAVIGNGCVHLNKEADDIFMPSAVDLALLAMKIDTSKYGDFPVEPFYLRDADTTKAKPLFSQ